MPTLRIVGLCAMVFFGWASHGQCDSAPRNMGVTFNGESDTVAPLAIDQWQTITASYRYEGNTSIVTNTYLVMARGGDLLHGLDLGYHVPTDMLNIVKHGFWNAMEAMGHPGEAGKVIENDQAYLDCEATKVIKTADEIRVAYRVKFKPNSLRGIYSVHQYIEDKNIRYEGFSVMGSVTIGDEGMVHRTDMPSQWQNSLKPQGKPAASLLLAENGKARYALVVPGNASSAEQKAAADLRRTLQLICGADFAVIAEDQLASHAGPFISIGRTQLLANAPCQWKTTDLKAEGYAIEVVGQTAFLYGGSGRGLLHGVYALLEEDLGCRWYSLNSVDTPRNERLEVSLVPRMFVPTLELRDPYVLKMHDPMWSLHNRTNTPHARIPVSWGGSIRYHLMGHTYASYFPADKYFAEHPEYFALVNRKRQPTQLCCTNKDVVRLSIEKTCEIFRNHPEVTITGIGPNDGRGFCDCPECKQLDDANGGRSGSYFHMINLIAEGVKKEFPNNHLIALTYLDYAKPPAQFNVDESVILQLCTDSHAWKYQFCPTTESDEFQGIIKAWHARKARMFIWDYTTDYVHYVVPMPNWSVVAENTRFNVRNGATGIMYESEMNDCDEMRAWVWAKQLWNPELDTKSLLRDFVFGYYKDSAEPLWQLQTAMWDYWEQWHSRPHKCGVGSANPLLNNLQCSYAPDGPMFTPEFMARMKQCIADAERLAKDDVIRARVKRAKLSQLYVELCQSLGYFTEFGDFVYGKSLSLPRSERKALQPEVDEFAALCKQFEISQLGIAGSPEKIVAKWQACIDAETAGQPRVFLPAEWLFAADSQDSGIKDRWFDNQRYFDAATKLTVGEETPLPDGSARVHINRGAGWEQQGFPGLDGYGWYFQTAPMPAELAGKKHLYLYLRGVNEQAWIYINGQLASQRTYASTGKGPSELTGTPIAFDAAPWLKPGVPNRIAIRVTHATGLGGITYPGMLIGSDSDCTPEQLDAYRQ